ncbi:MAG: hypothetical protein AAF743_11105 [Planctomycetota bacterium]
MLFWLLLGPMALLAAAVFWLRYRQPVDAEEPWRESLEEDDEPYDPEWDVDEEDEVDDDYDTDVQAWR